MTTTMLSVPIGTIIDYAGPNAPAGYLECDGSAVPRAGYPALFAAIGITWGAGDGSTTFNLPDLRGRTAIGAGTGTAGGATAHALASKGGDERLAGHSHTVPKHGHGFTQPTVDGGGVTNGISGGSHVHPCGLQTNCAAGSARWGISDGTTTRSDIVKSQSHTHNLPNHTHSVSGGAVGDKAAFSTETSGGGLHRTCSPTPSCGRSSEPPEGGGVDGGLSHRWLPAPGRRRGHAPERPLAAARLALDDLDGNRRGALPYRRELHLRRGRDWRPDAQAHDGGPCAHACRDSYKEPQSFDEPLSHVHPQQQQAEVGYRQRPRKLYVGPCSRWKQCEYRQLFWFNWRADRRERLVTQPRRHWNGYGHTSMVRREVLEENRVAVAAGGGCSEL